MLGADLKNILYFWSTSVKITELKKEVSSRIIPEHDYIIPKSTMDEGFLKDIDCQTSIVLRELLGDVC